MHLTGASDIAAEQSVLGAVFLDASVLDEIVFLEERDFCSLRHQQIYKVMRFLEKRGEPVDVISVTETYNKFGRIDEMGGVGYLSELAASCPTTANTEYYARLIRSKGMERRIKNTAEIIKGMSRDDYDSDEEFFSFVEGLITEMRPQDNDKMKTFSEMRQDYFKYLKTPAHAQFIQTGFEQFDAWSKGLKRNWLFVSAGRPSVGKTAMLLQRLQGVALQNKGAVLVYSQEMKKEQLIDRWLSNATGISYSRILSKNLDSKDMDKILIAYEEFEDLPLYVQDTAGVTIDEVKATAKQIKKKHGRLAVIAVDYLQIMKIPQRKGESRAQAIGNVTGEAKRIAMDLDCCFILLSQMSRSFEQASKPQLSHLKESGSIEQDADVVEFL